jgi:hypothetical protein
MSTSARWIVSSGSFLLLAVSATLAADPAPAPPVTPGLEILVRPDGQRIAGKLRGDV